jgi:copper chaperone CopZ
MAACTVCEIHAECVFKVEGMDCHEEVAILDRTLKKLSGLEAVDADVLAQRLRVKYDAARLSTSTIAEAVAQTGMRAWLEHDEPAGPPVSAATRRTYVVVSGVMCAGSGVDWRIHRLDRLRQHLHGAPRDCSGASARARHQRVDARRRRRSRRAEAVV